MCNPNMWQAETGTEIFALTYKKDSNGERHVMPTFDLHTQVHTETYTTIHVCTHMQKKQSSIPSPAIGTPDSHCRLHPPLRPAVSSSPGKIPVSGCQSHLLSVLMLSSVPWILYPSRTELNGVRQGFIFTQKVKFSREFRAGVKRYPT